MRRPGLTILKADCKELLCSSVQVPLKTHERWPQRGSTGDVPPAFTGGSTPRSPRNHIGAGIPPGRDCANPVLPDGSQEPCLLKWWEFNSGVMLLVYWMVGSFLFSSYIPWGRGPFLKRQ